MPFCRAVATTNGNRTVPVDNGITLTEASRVNIDTALPLAKAAIEAGTIEAIEGDATAAPKYATLPAAGSNV